MSDISSICKQGNLFLRDDKCDYINDGNIPCKHFYFEAVFYKWKYNFECWIFVPPLFHLYVPKKFKQDDLTYIGDYLSLIDEF